MPATAPACSPEPLLGRDEVVLDDADEGANVTTDVGLGGVVIFEASSVGIEMLEDCVIDDVVAGAVSLWKRI